MRTVIESLMWLLLAAGVGFGVRSLRDPVPHEETIAPVRARSPRLGQPYALDSLARLVIARDLFRPDRRPAPSRFDPNRLAIAAAPPPKPVLTVRGIVASDSPRALIEGFPGVPGSRLVRPGETFGGIRVIAIGPGAVRLSGLDTTWLLALRRSP